MSLWRVQKFYVLGKGCTLFKARFFGVFLDRASWQIIEYFYLTVWFKFFLQLAYIFTISRSFNTENLMRQFDQVTYQLSCTGSTLYRTIEMYFCIFIIVVAFVFVLFCFFSIFFIQNTNSFILLCIVTAKPHAVPIFIFLSFKLEFHYMVASLISLFSILEKLRLSCYRKGVQLF